ncbi:hypothetical protein ACCO45_004895 [Purpureocillium lilacinum]|uniref:Uncharacterized protein n=1 Tax=Purpureocillium lilacinum TaxID=33203 RepID=A0ACC4DUS5_PURLI
MALWWIVFPEIRGNPRRSLLMEGPAMSKVTMAMRCSPVPLRSRLRRRTIIRENPEPKSCIHSNRFQYLLKGSHCITRKVGHLEAATVTLDRDIKLAHPTLTKSILSDEQAVQPSSGFR